MENRLCFNIFLLFILKESSFKRTLYLFGAFLFHYSAILFLLVYLAGVAVVRVSKGNKVLIVLYLILIGGSVYLMVFKTAFWGVLLSGGAVADLYTRAATSSEVIKRVIIVVPLLLLLLLIPCERRLLDLWAFCVGGANFFVIFNRKLAALGAYICGFDGIWRGICCILSKVSCR